MNPGRTGIAIAAIGLVLLGALGTYEIWQALSSETINLRGYGISRTQQPGLFWAAFVVSVTIAAPMWLVICFGIIIGTLTLFSRKAR